MPKLPRNLSGREAVRAFHKAGWKVRKIGPHIILEKEGTRPTLSVPAHKTLDPGTLRSLIRYSGLTIEQFLSQGRQIIDLKHTHIVDVYDCDEDRGLSFMVEEYIESETLRDLLEANPGKPLPFDLALSIVEKITQALQSTTA